MDRISKSLLEEFVAEHGLLHLSEDKAFEHFAGFLATSRHHSETLSPMEIAVGDGGDCGIDCLAIIANGALITEADEVDELVEANGYLDVIFVLTQAERSASFSSAKIGQFGFGVRDFFSENPQLPQNDALQEFAEITNKIFAYSSKFRRGNPRCLMYYITTGRWVEDQNLVTRRDGERGDVEALGIFRDVVFECVGSERIQELYQDTKNATSAEISFPSRTALPEIQGVEQAYVGVVSGTDYLKLLRNDSGEILASLFYDNVRHWQQWNPVNKEIKETICDNNSRQFFPLLNNGVTIVARRINTTGNRVLIEDYQIVNGCQTSYIIHECSDSIDENMLVPIRLIATQDTEVRNSIIKATNRQTEVTEDQLFALSDFPKQLERFFPTYDGKKGLYYERRSRQYNQTEGIEKVRVVDMRTMVRNFASIFLDSPHRTTRNYRSLLQQVGTNIFNRDHKLEPYYTAAYAAFRLEFLFRRQVIDTSLKPARYHILMAFRYYIGGKSVPRMNSNEIVRWCSTINETLWDDSECEKLFVKAKDQVIQTANGDLHRDNIRTESFTNNLKQSLTSEE